MSKANKKKCIFALLKMSLDCYLHGRSLLAVVCCPLT